MAGIDSIIERILTEARESADARVARAESDAEKLIAKKKDQAKEEEDYSFLCKEVDLDQEL